MVVCRWIHPTSFRINRYQVNFVKGVILWQLNKIIALKAGKGNSSKLPFLLIYKHDLVEIKANKNASNASLTI